MKLLCYICRHQIVNTTLMEHVRRFHPHIYQQVTVLSRNYQQ